ncbi:flagellar biosynthesis protein FlhB [Paenibacillus xanthanilyticus]|uniref:Flagellar biosynthetic protein FlhB n=1 Tax=Paenibacillus xanthanilyticus TaxID=1783531 RepID=A0ABV8KBZ6_9BACL
MHTYRLRLDLQLFSGEKTEKATPKKRQEARKKGQVAKSQELPGALILLFSLLCLLILGDFYKDRLFRMFALLFQQKLSMNLTTENIMTLFTDITIQGAILLAPILAIAVIFAMVGTFVQIGFLFTGENLKLKFSKLSPLQGFKNIFSMRSAVEFLKNILKLTIIGFMVYRTLWGSIGDILKLSHVPVENMLSFTAHLVMNLGITIGAILVVLALIDYMYQKFEHEKSLRMSMQDIKDEYKKSEGDPLIKGKIRERQRRMAMQRMMSDVPKADVVITNPTHYAVALRYDGTKMEAPTIVAKGADYVALRIREIAKNNGVVTMENKPLARALYARAEIGENVPADLFQAVAEVLAYVYRLKGRAK